MAGQVKLSHYEGVVTFVTPTAIVADYTSEALDFREYRRGFVQILWSGYDGTDGKIKLQMASEANSPDSEWADWGGDLGTGKVAVAADHQTFHIWDQPPAYIRAQFIMGDGTTATVSAKHRMGS